MNRNDWIKKCASWRERWPVFQLEYNDDLKNINIYCFIETLSDNLKDDSIVISDAGSSLYTCAQKLKLSRNQRWICSWAQSQMGASLSMACGAFYASDKKECIVVVGDGSLNTQISALAIIRKHNIPLKIFVLNNSGYLSIKSSQDKFYKGRRIGTDSNDGYFFPQIEDIANTYQIHYYKIKKIDGLDSGIKYIQSLNEPVICEVICPELQEIIPCMMPKKDKNGNNIQVGLDDMYPWLSEEELEKETIKD